MKRLAIVVQRYGDDVNGGAELHARLLAQHLARRYEVEILTSCARDYTDWRMVYPAGRGSVDGIPVVRFEHPVRNDIGRARVPLVHNLRFNLRWLLRRLPGHRVLRPRGDADFDGLGFLRRQGPHCPGLLAHLDASAERYDAVIFFAALYEPTALGIQRWGRRSILVPLLHDEKPMYLPVFHAVLRSAGAILFNTESERRLAQRLYGLDTRDAPIAGLGIEATAPDPASQARVLARHGLAPGYLVYVGRIDVAKGCRELVAAFIEHARHDSTTRLVLVGQVMMPVPQHPRITCTGFVTVTERDALIAAAAALLIPSRYESLSMVLLEAMLLQVPVIANGLCEVLDDHIRLSACGIAYRGRRQLVAAMGSIPRLTAIERARIGALGADYVRRQYGWSRVLAVFDESVQRVSAFRNQVPPNATS